MGVYIKYSLTPFYGELVISSALWPIGPLWCFIAFRTYQFSMTTYGLRPYPETIGPLANSPPHHPQANTFVFWTGGSIARAFVPTPLIMGSKASMAEKDNLGPLPPLWPTVHGTFRPFLAYIQLGKKETRGTSTSLQVQVGPKPQVGQPEPILAPVSTIPKWPKKPRTQNLPL
ncbi:hypothetical protein O181_073532 [Austropuccinia psidii MF-1]|uniref:Uncharacterized protein n=1 Tax=Austropuccinia psidii MF-1 TaxID=1389203 RepID=A0A9Q3IB49_9BASI|nr:hypothetical protein [Austropuccinia psidii MF-1]